MASEKTLTVLGIETSCDETAAAVVRLLPGERGEILSDVVLSQVAEHAEYGGVVPEIAARAHLVYINDMVRRAMAGPSTRWPRCWDWAIRAARWWNGWRKRAIRTVSPCHAR